MAGDNDIPSTKSPAVKHKQADFEGGFEFVLMGADGALNKTGISQIRAHTTRELHKMRRQNGQVVVRRRRNRPGNIFSGSQVDPFQMFPQFLIENQKPGLLDEVKHHVFSVYNQKEMQQLVWPLGGHDHTFLTSMLLMCSVHIDGLRMGSASAVTTSLKLEVMRRVQEKLQQSTQAAVMSCIAGISCLATCALVRGEVGGAEEYVTHRTAYAVLIKEAMERGMFEESRFAKELLRIITVIAIGRRCCMPTLGLAPPLDTRTMLKDYEHIFEDHWRSRTHADPELYSPLYDGRTDPDEDPFPFVTTPYLRLHLQMIQSVLQIWLQQVRSPLRHDLSSTLVLESLCQRILAMPSARRPNSPCYKDHIYEACRLTSVLMIRSMESHKPWREVVKGTTMLKDISDMLKCTDINNLWGANIGLLYWVVMVYHCAAFATPNYPLGHTLQSRIQFELTYSYQDWHGALEPMGVLCDLILAVSSPIAVRARFILPSASNFRRNPEGEWCS